MGHSETWRNLWRNMYDAPRCRKGWHSLLRIKCKAALRAKDSAPLLLIYYQHLVVPYRVILPARGRREQVLYEYWPNLSSESKMLKNQLPQLAVIFLASID